MLTSGVIAGTNRRAAVEYCRPWEQGWVRSEDGNCGAGGCLSLCLSVLLRLVLATMSFALCHGAGLSGLSVTAPSVPSPLCRTFPANTSVTLSGNGGTVVEPAAFVACTLSFGTDAAVTPLATATVPSADTVFVLAARVAVGTGSIVAFASPFGSAAAAVTVPAAGVDETLESPYPLLAHVTAVLTSVLQATTVVHLPPSLTYVAGVVSPSNNTFSLLVRRGRGSAVGLLVNSVARTCVSGLKHRAW